jgi:hypothetical protein
LGGVRISPSYDDAVDGGPGAGGFAVGSADDPIVRFYRGGGRDGAGRTIDQVWAFPTEDLEAIHDFIQWLFPLRERSAFVPGAPTLTDATVDAFRGSDELRARLRRSLDVMLAFYGLGRVGRPGGPVSIEPGPALATRGPRWWGAENHNHRRLTRIIASLAILGLGAESRALERCLERVRAEHPTGISPETVRYWAAATERR